MEVPDQPWTAEHQISAVSLGVRSLNKPWRFLGALVLSRRVSSSDVMSSLPAKFTLRAVCCVHLTGDDCKLLSEGYWLEAVTLKVTGRMQALDCFYEPSGAGTQEVRMSITSKPRCKDLSTLTRSAVLYPLLLTHTDTLSPVSSLQGSEIKKFAPFLDSRSDKQD